MLNVDPPEEQNVVQPRAEETADDIVGPADLGEGDQGDSTVRPGEVAPSDDLVDPAL